MVWADGTRERPLTELKLDEQTSPLPNEIKTGTMRPVTQLRVPYQGRELTDTELIDPGRCDSHYRRRSRACLHAPGLVNSSLADPSGVGGLSGRVAIRGILHGGDE